MGENWVPDVLIKLVTVVAAGSTAGYLLMRWAAKGQRSKSKATNEISASARIKSFFVFGAVVFYTGT